MSGTTTTNARTGRGLRVFVDRPWYTTGDTEQLAVIVNPQGTAPTSLAGFVSQWGMDPIRNPQSDTLAILDQNQVVGGTLTTGVPLAETPSQSVTILAFNPAAYDPTRQLWYFDIEFGASLVEAPFVRLALARYQANSLGAPAFPNATSGDLRMSTVVLADMVKLSADRTGSYLVNADGSVNVTVSGQVYADAAWTPGAANTVNTVNASATDGRMVFAQVLETTVATPGEFDWTPVEPAPPLPISRRTSLPARPETAPRSRSSGSVPKPTNLNPLATHHQLHITEHEVFYTDTEAAFPGTGTVNNFPPGAMQMRPRPAPPAFPLIHPNTTSRIIFSDILPLTY